MLRETYLSFLVFVGGGFGAVLRHTVNRLTIGLAGGFPIGTMMINIVGSLVIGLLAGWFTFRGEQTGQELRLLLVTGVVGGFTTFSAFTLDLALMWERGASLPAAGYLFGSVGLSLVAVFAGLAISKGVFG